MALNTKWTAREIGDLQGRLAVVTGASGGIGFEAARVLAAKGAQVILAVRDLRRGEAAAQLIRRETPSSRPEVMRLDLSDLGSVERFVKDFNRECSELTLLINNAGIMAVPLSRTANGFEAQFGTNHLGHFALTGLLLPNILAANNARVITVSSQNHKFASIAFDNLNGEVSYRPLSAYNQSKLANLMFAYELQRRLAAVGARAISVGCHPGYSATNLQLAGPRMAGSAVTLALMKLMNRALAQSAAMGALSILCAATDPDIKGGDYIGPTKLGGMRGYPSKVSSHARSRDEVLAARLWQVSEEMTGVRYDFRSLE